MEHDLRKNERHAISLGVQLKTSIACTLSDISILGARLTIDNPQSLPDEFLLELNEGLQRWCRVRWRSEHELGVEFTNLPGQPPPQAAPDAPAEAGALGR